MDLSGEYVIPVSRERVWDLLNDPEVLKRCIPGCEEINQTSEDAFEAAVVLKVGPVKARFTGAVELKDKVYPESYRISGEGKGGVAGFASGGADVRLSDAEGGTLLAYTVDANVGGKIAQLGSRLIKSTSAKLAAQFFARFGEIAAQDATA